MNISASLVRDLREKTGVGMMECKKALQESEGDMEKAVLWLRERGMARAAKKSGRVTAEGAVVFGLNADHTTGVLVEVNCETDFVSKNEDFIEFGNQLVNLAVSKAISSVEELKESKLPQGQTVNERLTELISKVGENIQVRRLQAVIGAKVAGYSHMGGKIGTLVGVNVANVPEDALKDLAMHTAASFPKYLEPTEVPAAEVETEKDLARKKLLDEGKPADIIEKILQGSVTKYYKEVCLTEQPFVKEPKQSVAGFLNSKVSGGKITAFARFQLGEGIEKAKEDFAEEVAKASRV